MRKRTKSLGIIISLSILFLLGSALNGLAMDPNLLLKGKYAATSVMTCAAGPVGSFNEDFSRNDDGGAFTASIKGLATYHGDGTGEAVFTVLIVKPALTQAGEFPIIQVEGTTTFTYTVNRDRSFTWESDNISIIQTVGPSVGLEGTIIGVFKEGRIGDRGKTIIFSDTEPNIETVSFINGNTLERICYRSGSGVKIR